MACLSLACLINMVDSVFTNDLSVKRRRNQDNQVGKSELGAHKLRNAATHTEVNKGTSAAICASISSAIISAAPQLIL